MEGSRLCRNISKLILFNSLPFPYNYKYVLAEICNKGLNSKILECIFIAKYIHIWYNSAIFTYKVLLSVPCSHHPINIYILYMIKIGFYKNLMHPCRLHTPYSNVNKGVTLMHSQGIQLGRSRQRKLIHRLSLN